MAQILIVEDSPTQAQELALILEEQGFQTQEASNAEDALDLYRKSAFDVILSDVVMPGKTGYDLCREIKDDPKGKETPVILLTTLNQPMDVIRGLECGADNFITKPYDAGYLLARINTILANKALRGNRRMHVGVDLMLMGTRVTISSEREQILDVLMTTFEELMRTREREEQARIAEESNRKSREFLQSAMDALSARIAILDRSGKIDAVNATWPDFLRVTPLLGPDCTVGADLLDRCRQAKGPMEYCLHQVAGGIERLLSEKRDNFKHEVGCQGPSGTRWFQMCAARFPGPENIQVAVAFEDITERKRAEKQQAAELAVTRALAESGQLPDAAARVLPAIGGILGWQAAALWITDRVGQVLRCVGFWSVPEERYSSFEQATWHTTLEDGPTLPGRVWQSGDPQWIADVGTEPGFVRVQEATAAGLHGAFAFPIKLENDVLGVVELYHHEVLQPDEQMPAMAAVIGNAIGQFVERKRLEDQFKQAQKMEAVGRLAGGIAHDFNNLLTVINGYSELALMKLPASEPLHPTIEEIKKAGERAAALTRQLLAFSRKQVLLPESLHLSDLTMELEKIMSRLIGEDIDLLVTHQSDLWRIKADRGQLEQVIMNLVVNSRDAMPQGGRLTIATKNVVLDEDYVRSHPYARPGEYVVLAVSDSGCGMDKATQAKIFEPFFSTKGEKGTGLGLATCYGIVKQSQGHIEVYSELGVGTTFQIYFPRDLEGRPLRKSNQGVRQVGKGTETILVVEDQVEVRDLIRMILEENGYHYLEAASGIEAVELAQRHQGAIHLLVTDVVMPNMSGPQLVERLTSMRTETKVLYISGYTDEAIVHHGLLDSDTPFLQKPFSPNALIHKLREVLDE